MHFSPSFLLWHLPGPQKQVTWCPLEGNGLCVLGYSLLREDWASTQGAGWKAAYSDGRERGDLWRWRASGSADQVANSCLSFRPAGRGLVSHPGVCILPGVVHRSSGMSLYIPVWVPVYQ